MLSATRKSDDKLVLAYFEKRSDGPFLCIDCGKEVLLKAGRSKINHFAHAIPQSCELSRGESALHRRCKLEIYEALKTHPNVQRLSLEVPLGPVRPDIFAHIGGVPVAIEVQVSSLSLNSLIERTIWYHRKGIYVLWLLQWTPKLDAKRYAPKLWEKWIRAAYFGRVYYWTKGSSVVSYSFEPHVKTVPLRSFRDKRGKMISVGGYAKRSKRFRTAIRGETFNIADDFRPKERFWWKSDGLTVPDGRLFIDRFACEFHEILDRSS